MHFENSQLLWLTALIVPLLGLFFWWAWRRRALLLTQFIHAKLADQLTLGLSHGRRLAKLGLLLVITTLLMLALARPKVRCWFSCSMHLSSDWRARLLVMMSAGFSVPGTFRNSRSFSFCLS